LAQGGELTINATVRDSATPPNLVENGTLVRFSSDKGSITSSSVTTNGVAQATFQAGSTGGIVEITSTSGDAISNLTFEVATGIANSIVTESIEPNMIGVAGSGINDTALITFAVGDTSGNAAPDGTVVNFSIQTGVSGGETLSSASGTTAGGKVTVSLQAGTVAGTVSVLATFVNEDGNTIANVAPVTIVRNRPDANRITLGAETLNIAGGVINGLQTTIRAYLGDRAGNVVPDGTPVSFYSECGTIGDSAGFVSTSSFGVSEAVLQSSSPTTPDLDGLDTDGDGEGEGNVGLCRVMAATPGKGAFQDNNGNGVFDSSVDVCTTTLDEPYIDANDNGQYDLGEYFVNIADLPGGTDGHDQDVVDCETNVMIWTSMNILMSGQLGELNAVGQVTNLNLDKQVFAIKVGQSTDFSFSLSDIYGNALVPGTTVLVETTAGTLSGTTEFEMPGSTNLGPIINFALGSESDPTVLNKPAAITVTVTSPTDGNMGPGGGEVTFGASGLINVPTDATGVTVEGEPVSSGDPANILFEVTADHIAVAGVGQIEQSTILIQVLDDSGNSIDEASYGDDTLNNLRVSFDSAPRGGEYISGANAAGDVVDTQSSGSIDVRTEGGSIALNLQSGTLPGAVEIKVEALVNADGVALTSPVTATSPKVVIASGPPHTIVLTSALTGSIQNLAGEGVYRRQGTAIVTDRYGNHVPDGTAIYLGLMDSIISQGTTTAVNGTTVSAPAGDFNTTITRNEIERGIQSNDRIILRGVPAQDKNRHVVTSGGGSLVVQTEYSDAYGAKDYFIGASLLGGHISGTQIKGSGVLSPGESLTADGLADVFVTYPANVNTINLGCGSVPAFDNRHLPVSSAKSIVVAASSDDSAITVDEGQFCFSPIAGYTLSIIPEVPASSSTDRGLTLIDGGDEIPVPFQPLSSFVAVTTLGTANVCADATNADKTSCETADTPLNPHSWLSNYGVCRIEAVANDADCTADGNTWFTGLTSDFDVKVYFNTFAAAGFDIDGDGFNDVAWVGAVDTDADGIPDDFNGDGLPDINDSAAIPVDFDSDAVVDFYNYPYTFANGNATTQIMVTGDLIVSGDTAAVTIVGGDGDAEVSVVMP